MTSSGDTDYSDLVQTTQSGPKVQYTIENLMNYFDVEAIAAKEGYSKVECSYDVSKALDEVRDEFKKEFIRSKKIVNIVKMIIGRPGKTLDLSGGVSLLVFQSGWSNLEEIVGKDNCIILIPVVIAGSDEGTLQEQTTDRRTTFKFETNSELMVTARCSIWIPQGSKVVCVVLCAGKDKG